MLRCHKAGLLPVLMHYTQPMQSTTHMIRHSH